MHQVLIISQSDLRNVDVKLREHQVGGVGAYRLPVIRALQGCASCTLARSMIRS